MVHRNRQHASTVIGQAAAETASPPAKLPMDKMLYLVICSHKGQQYVAERDLSDMDSGTTLKDIAAGEFTNLVRVLVFNPVEHICTDVTKDVARAVTTLWASQGEPLTCWQRNFVELHVSVQAANSFAMEEA